MDLIRSTLQPITHNLPPPVRDLGVNLLGAPCYESLLIDIDPSDQECLKLAVSKALGLGIVGASSIVKVPQIAKLLSSRSAAGVSFLSYLLESTSYLISLAYNYRSEFPFSTYGESALILAQNIVIAVLVLRFSGRSGLAALFVAGLAVAAHSLFSGTVVDKAMLSYLQAGAGTLSVVSKVPQILSIWKQGGTGQLSAFTVSPHVPNPLPFPSITFRQKHELTPPRSSTTSSAPSPASSPPSRRSTTSSSSTASSPASPSTPCSPPKCSTTGTPPPPSPPPARARRPWARTAPRTGARRSRRRGRSARGRPRGGGAERGI